MTDPWASTVPGYGEPTDQHPNAAAATTEPVVVVDPTPVAGIPMVTTRRRWPRRIAWTAVALVVLLGGYYAITLYQVHDTGQGDEARPVDAIVVMGAAQYDGRPSPQLAARLDHALALWQQGLADVVVVTGGRLPGDRFTEAEASAAYLVERGVPESAILLENESRNSYDAIAGVAALLDAQGRRSVLLVSDPFHSLRIELTARELGLEAYVSPTRTSPVQGRSALVREMKEAAGVSLGRIIGFRRLLAITG